MRGSLDPLPSLDGTYLGDTRFILHHAVNPYEHANIYSGLLSREMLHVPKACMSECERRSIAGQLNYEDTFASYGRIPKLVPLQQPSTAWSTVGSLLRGAPTVVRERSG